MNTPTTITMVLTSCLLAGNNDRTTFNLDALRELAGSIKEHGLLQPPTVRPIQGTTDYEVVAGERRLRAVRDVLGWTEIPVIIRELTNREASVLMLLENVSRKDLDPIDEATAYQRRLTEGMTKEEICAEVGVPLPRITNRIKLLKCCSEVQQLCKTGSMSLWFTEMLAFKPAGWMPKSLTTGMPITEHICS